MFLKRVISAPIDRLFTLTNQNEFCFALAFLWSVGKLSERNFNPDLVPELQKNHEINENNPFLDLLNFDGGNWEETVICRGESLSQFFKELKVLKLPFQGVLVIYYDQDKKAHAIGFAAKKDMDCLIYESRSNNVYRCLGVDGLGEYIEGFIKLNSPRDLVSTSGQLHLSPQLKVSLISYSKNDKENRGVQSSF